MENKFLPNSRVYYTVEGRDIFGRYLGADSDTHSLIRHANGNIIRIETRRIHSAK